MGLLDGLLKSVTEKFLGGEGSNPLLGMVDNLLSGPQSGGLSGLIQTFNSKGLGNVISSWVGTGENLPISGQQIQQMAEKLGTSKEEVSGGLASLLPQLVDKLTPNGSVPEPDMLEKALKMFKSGSA
ncbi:MAG: YidB family protein [Thermodesulfobacteriota bacterium]|jgi:uncharacterized protein YidB (DUF937 family)